jgi:hypothetical protein
MTGPVILTPGKVDVPIWIITVEDYFIGEPIRDEGLQTSTAMSYAAPTIENRFIIACIKWGEAVRLFAE